MIKVFVDAHVFDGEFQGSATYIREIYNELIIERPDILFYFGAHNLEKLKINFIDAPNVKYIKYKFTNSIIRLGIELPILLLKNKITYAHFQYITPFFKVCKYLVTIHDVLFFDFKSEFSKLFRIKNGFFLFGICEIS